MKHFIFIIFVCLTFCGCDWFEYHPYDGRVTGATNINAKNIERITQICKDKDSFTFAMIGDSHRSYDEAEKMVKALNKRTDIDFIIHGGDISEYGVTKEFIWHRNLLQGLKAPYVALIGNHDCLGNGESVFKKIWGELNFSFVAGNTRFICLNTNAFEYDYSNPVPDFNFIENELKNIPDNVEKHVVVMHARPFCEQFNNNVAKVFELYISQFKNLQFCLNAHNHKLEADDLFGDGIIYYGCSCFADRNYLLFTIKPGGYTYDVVYF